MEPAQSVCAVIVTVDAGAEAMPAIEAHARFGLTQFPQFEGFVSGALHKSADGTRLVQYLRWSGKAQYERCIGDPRWDDLPSTQQVMALVRHGDATMDVRVYDVVATAEDR